MTSTLTEQPALSADACLCLALRKAARVVTRSYDAAMAPHKLTSGQFSILAHITARSDFTLVALAEAMALDQSSLSRALRPLMRDGLVVLECDVSDARRRLLVMTEAGRARLIGARVAWATAQTHAHSALGNGQLSALRDALNILTQLPET